MEWRSPKIANEAGRQSFYPVPIQTYGVYQRPPSNGPRSSHQARYLCHALGVLPNTSLLSSYLTMGDQQCNSASQLLLLYKAPLKPPFPVIWCLTKGQKEKCVFQDNLLTHCFFFSSLLPIFFSLLRLALTLRSFHVLCIPLPHRRSYAAQAVIWGQSLSDFLIWKSDALEKFS